MTSRSAPQSTAWRVSTAATGSPPDGSLSTAPPSAGDLLHYTVNLMAASGANYAGAFDAGLVDTLSLGLVYVTGTARVGGVAVEPVVAGDGMTTPQTLTWAGTIDIPEGTNVPILYDVRVPATVVAGQTLTNSVIAQWTGLDGASGNERTGSGTPAYNDYFTGPASTSLVVSDNNSLTKAIIADAYVDAPSTAADKIVRIGDTATYRLTLKLGEGTNRSVTVRDALPAGMALQSFSVIAGAHFSYALGLQPAGGATGTVRWEFGDIINTPDGISTDDALVIRYVAKVVTDAPPAGVGYNTSILRDNLAKLSYTGGDPAVFVSVSAAHQGPEGGGPVAAIADLGAGEPTGSRPPTPS